jgi:hypothetical protein
VTFTLLRLDVSFINRLIDQKHRSPHDPVKFRPCLRSDDFDPFSRNR